MRRPLPVWGFPNHYNPNLMGEVCQDCGSAVDWMPRPISGQDFTAWTCLRCAIRRDQPM